MNIFKKNNQKEKLPSGIKRLRSWLINVSKGCAFLLFTFFIAFLLNEPDLVLNKTQYFLSSFFSFSFFFYFLAILLTSLASEIYTGIESLFSKTSKEEREKILNLIKETNPDLTITEKLCLEHLVEHDKKVSYLSISKKMNKIKT